jgi:predicted ferric reductase
MPATLRRLRPALLALAVTAALTVWAFPDDLPPMRAAGVVLGWIGCGLLLSSLALALREPRLASWLGGIEAMVFWHQWCGFAGYLALLAHPLALAAAFLPATPIQAWQTVSPFSESWPVWTGWLSLIVLMVGLGATYAQRLAYRTRRILHAAMGAGVMLGLVHLMLLGIDEPVEPILAAAALLLGWRAVKEDWGLGALPFVVSRVKPVAEGVVEITLKPLADAVSARPGQFVVVAFYSGRSYRGCGEFHPFTVSAGEASGDLRIAVKAVGDCTRRMQNTEPGVAARVQGPFGELHAEARATPELWVAGGMGVTPFLALLRAGHLTAPTTLLYLYRTPADAAFLAELEAFARADDRLRLRAVPTGLDLPDLDAVLPDASTLVGRECYVSGPLAMVRSVTRALRKRGVAACRVHSENLQVL